MKIYVKNELYGKGNARLAKMLVRDYKAVFNNGAYCFETIETIDELNKLVRRMIETLGEVNIYPFITPFKESLMITLRQINRDTMCFK